MRTWTLAALVVPVVSLSAVLWLTTAEVVTARSEIERLESDNLTLRVEVDALRRGAVRKGVAANLIPPQTLPTGEGKP